MAQVSGNRVQTWTRRVGDTLDSFAATLKDANGVAVDLTGATVAFRLVSAADESVVVNDAAATIDDAEAGQVSYGPSSGDVDTAGTYYAYFVVTSGGATATYPKDERAWIVELWDDTD